MDQVTAGCVSRCRLRFPSDLRHVLSFKIFVYREGCHETTSYRIRYPRLGGTPRELILDAQVSSEGLIVNRINTLGANDEPLTQSWKGECSTDSAQSSDRMWLGVYSQGIGDIMLEDHDASVE
eukprot:PhF_6_TR10045/c0_g1_i2/m.15460